MAQDDDDSDLDEVLYAAAQPTSLALSGSCSTPTRASSASASTAATPPVQSETPSALQSLARKSEQLGKKAKRTSESQKGFLKEPKEMNVELQEQQFKHEQAMQENWAQFLDKRDEEREKRETERRAEEMKVMRETENDQQKHAQQMLQNHMDLMCMLLQKYGL